MYPRCVIEGYPTIGFFISEKTAYRKKHRKDEKYKELKLKKPKRNKIKAKQESQLYFFPLMKWIVLSLFMTMSRICLKKIARFIQEAVEKEVFRFVPCVATCEYPETDLESASLPGSSREATQLCKKDR